MAKRLPTMWETRVQSLGQQDVLEKAMATHSSILAWKIPWTEEPVGYSPWGRKELDMTEQFHFTFLVIFFLIFQLHLMGIWNLRFPTRD